jgi:hypothetical protein
MTGAPTKRPELVQAIRDCAARGMSRDAAAVALDISYDSIKGFARRYSIDFIRDKTGPKCGRSAAQRNRNRADTGGTPRKCLCGCGKMFASLSAGDRIAPECRNAWAGRYQP